jgi:hypothetical protein
VGAFVSQFRFFKSTFAGHVFEFLFNSQSARSKIQSKLPNIHPVRGVNNSNVTTHTMANISVTRSQQPNSALDHYAFRSDTISKTARTVCQTATTKQTAPTHWRQPVARKEWHREHAQTRVFAALHHPLRTHTRLIGAAIFICPTRGSVRAHLHPPRRESPSPRSRCSRERV